MRNIGVSLRILLDESLVQIDDRNPQPIVGLLPKSFAERQSKHQDQQQRHQHQHDQRATIAPAPRENPFLASVQMGMINSIGVQSRSVLPVRCRNTRSKFGSIVSMLSNSVRV